MEGHLTLCRMLCNGPASPACESRVRSLVEVRAALEQGKRLLLVHESDPEHGGGSLEDLMHARPVTSA